LHGRHRRAATSCSVLALAVCGALATAPSARAADQSPTAEGQNASELIVTAERNKAAATAPTKGSVTETQPEAIISHQFIEQVTPETGDYTTTVLIAPSMAGISSNGGGIGEYNKVTLRGFQDGQYNVTYDGIFYGDTNDPTHHPASFFPSSTIGSVVIDRGPGAAGDLGQANYGGAIHFFSQEVADRFGLYQKATFGSFNTYGLVTNLQSGPMAPFANARMMIGLDERFSDGELSFSRGKAFNQLLKVVAPIGESASLTLFASYNYARFYQPDAGPGATLAQVAAYGKNFGLNNNPADEHYWGYNYEKKRTDFEYFDFNTTAPDMVHVEDQGYTYFYSNKTIAADDTTGLVGGTNTSHPGNKNLPQTDIGGYDKLNRYRVFGDILRVNKDWNFGTLKVGGLVETSSTDRHNLLIDLTQGGIPDLKYAALPPATTKNVSNVKTLEFSNWLQFQVFGDFIWRPTDNLTITPGIKYVHLKRSIDGVMENSGAPGFPRGPVVGDETFTKPLYFLTANYRFQPDWSVYFQYATGFLMPSLSTLQTTALNLQALKPQESVNYQLGTVYSHGNLTFDADIYKIDISNLAVGNSTCQCYVNLGDGEYRGVEGEAAYATELGLTVFANGSLNHSEVSSSPTVAATEVPNAPEWTAAVGGIYYKGPWAGSLTFKEVGKSLSTDGIKMDQYNTTDASVSYDFGHFKLKLQGFNLFDNRSTTSISGGLYLFQVGRQVQGTIEAKF
jgi:iron complex outermembrane receptor protein